MSDYKEQMMRTAIYLRQKEIPFIIYCHSFGDTSGMTVCKLVPYHNEVKSPLGKVIEVIDQNPLKTGFLKSLNKCMRSKRISGFNEWVQSAAYLAPLETEDREKVINLVTELKYAEILE